MMALTATATTRVREDIVKLLQLREPKCFVASFNRPNLTYRVIAKAKPSAQALAFLRRVRATAGSFTARAARAPRAWPRNLNQHGISARPYHAGLTAGERSETRNFSCATKSG
jgi:ATP-dependent DNA helicase RecQ